jgi:hypothetical protein
MIKPRAMALLFNLNRGAKPWLMMQ